MVWATHEKTPAPGDFHELQSCPAELHSCSQGPPPADQRPPKGATLPAQVLTPMHGAGRVGRQLPDTHLASYPLPLSAFPPAVPYGEAVGTLVGG